jgi:DNA-directed RNA polymerase subunit RPC12/RpoP
MQISLKCVNCGAALQVREGVSELACGYCGVQQIVQRDGGSVWLSLEKAIAEVKATADRAATEMTLRRLREEREEVRGQLDELRTRAGEASNAGFMSVYRLALTMVCVVGAVVILARMLDRTFFYSFGAGNLIVVAAILMFIVVGVMAGVNRQRSLSAREDAEADALLLEDQIADLDRQIEDQRLVVTVHD